MPGWRSRLSDWWFDYRPRLNRWTVTQYAYIIDGDGYATEEYELFCEYFQLTYLQARRLEKYLGYTDRPTHTVTRRWD